MSSTSSNEPAWTVEENTPLMGTGIMSLHDPESPPLRPSSIVPKDVLSDTDTDTDTVTPTAWKSNADESNQNNKKKNNKDKTIKVVRLPNKNPILYAFSWLEGTAIFGCLCLLATQLLPLMYMTAQDIGILPMCLRIYVGLFCILFILVEYQTPLPIIQSSLLLQTYFSRGFLYTFLGLICMEEAYSVRVNDMEEHRDEEFHVAWASLFMQGSSWLVVGVGVIYMLCGICCLRVVRDKMNQSYKEKMELYRSLESDP
jgi:hypothetical protein